MTIWELSFIIKIARIPATMGIIPKTMKNSQLLSFVGLYSDPSPINTITVANTGNTDKTVLTFPRFVSSVTSVVQVLNAASYAVEPANVIMQSNRTSKKPKSPRVCESARIGIAANNIMVSPQAMYPYDTKTLRFPSLSQSPPANIVVTVAVIAEKMTISVVTTYAISLLPEFV